MTCPECGCTVNWDCECSGSLEAEPMFDETRVLEMSTACGLAVLSRLAQEPPPAEGSRAYADRALVRLQQMLAAAGLLDRTEARVQDLPRALLR
jgi:hypothetical protein